MKIFIAGGGTGGHIYPAISIAEALLAHNSSTQILFIGTSLGLESKIIPKAGYQLELIQSGKLNFKGRILDKLKTLFKIPLGVIQSICLIIKHKPDYVLGVGGYASAPMIIAAVLLRKHVAVWEPNAMPGMANRILSKFVNKSYLVFEEAKKYIQSKNIQVFGMPLRAEVALKAQKKQDQATLNSDSALGAQHQNENSFQKEEISENKKFTLLCFGGSQGSVFLNDQLSDLILQNSQWHQHIHVVHQTGSLDYQRMLNKYNGLSCVEVFEYIYDMPKYYEKADMLFCRGGASTLAEAAVFGVIPVVVPLPAADDHQQKNAEALVKAQAGFMFLQKQFDTQEFKKTVESLMKDVHLKDQFSTRLKQMGSTQAAQAIAQDIARDVGM